MAKGTRAVQMLEKAGVAFSLHEYETTDGDLSYGEAVAVALGVESDRLFKTLIASVDGSPVVGIVPVSGQLSMKKLARAAGCKHATMTGVADAQRLSGYVVGGISPFGQRRRMPCFIDETAELFDTVFVSAGQRGLQVEIAPGDLITLTRATAADIAD